ncbi:hypothetical protein J8273_2741 [Carpediemonas membranifera]|uniref:Uncharacterized protein n=1 Tax=Carpediemonas membranifera TaxID=201153 RepID=A0A8J6E134_9EUKA|nr:hypothetical protein J8273_2741 [Carpediemonas membranifera]|eukprot:KAG9395829.1 hypothetical protein J8273_2741 [Carpediemonas membranifera]
MNKLLFFALIAVVLATNQFVFPADGDKMVIGRENNLTWTDGHFNLTDTLQLTFEFNSEFIQDLLKDTDMTSAQRTPDTCIPMPEINSIPVDLRIPVETIQDLVDSLNLPIEIDVESIVNNVLQNVDQISGVRSQRHHLPLPVQRRGARLPVLGHHRLRQERLRRRPRCAPLRLPPPLRAGLSL